ncbi:MAG TPA: NYN domain-containing protein [Thermomicrobiales bacterium]|nr:NYN domain-containing protein [Thermomicrobiales bacterium]
MVSDAHGSRPGDTDAAPKEVAVFIDFENIRYSTINSFGREPDPLTWRDKALQYGLMSVARAYADFDQHPPHVRTRLDVAGFELHHYPVKRSRDATGRDKITSRSDLNLVIDIINTALVRPDIEIFLLFTGDKDFIRLVTSLRNRLGKRVVICGVPGSISPDLVAAAGESDTIEMTQSADVDVAVIQAIDTYIKQLHEGFVPTQSHMSRTLWRFLDRNRLPSEHIEAKVMEFLRKGILTKRQTINGQGQELVTTELNAQHPLVLQAIPDMAVDVADDNRDEDYLYDDEDDALPEDEAEVVAAGRILESAPAESSNGTNDGSNGLREPVRYQRRFSTGNGAWRGRTNVRGDNVR